MIIDHRGRGLWYEFRSAIDGCFDKFEVSCWWPCTEHEERFVREVGEECFPCFMEFA